MKKILGLTVSAFLILAIVGGSTWAYFSDTETGSVSVTASTLDLDANGADSAQTIVSVSNKAPGDSDNSSVTIKNSGSITGELDISTGAVTNTESSGSTENEQDGGDGELGAVAQIAMFIDVDESSTYNSGDIGLLSDNTTYTFATYTTPQYATVNSYASKSWNASENMTAADQDKVYVLWQIPTTADNTIQGDSISFTITFRLEQTAAD